MFRPKKKDGKKDPSSTGGGGGVGIGGSSSSPTKSKSTRELSSSFGGGDGGDMIAQFKPRPKTTEGNMSVSASASSSGNANNNNNNNSNNNVSSPTRTSQTMYGGTNTNTNTNVNTNTQKPTSSGTAAALAAALSSSDPNGELITPFGVRDRDSSNDKNSNDQSMRIKMKQQIKASKLRRAAAAANANANDVGQSAAAAKEHLKKLRKYHVRDPSDPVAIGDLVSLITPIRPSSTPTDGAGAGTDDGNNNNNSNNKAKRSSSSSNNNRTILNNECLLALHVKSFEFSGNTMADNHNSNNNNTSTDGHGHGHVGDLAYIRKNITSHMNPKSKNKFRYVCITRSTNLTLMKRRRGKVFSGGGEFVAGGGGGGDEIYRTDDGEDAYGEESSSSDGEDDEDVDSTDGYDTLYNPDDNDDGANERERNRNRNRTQQQQRHSSNASVVSKMTKTDHLHGHGHADRDKFAEESSSFPNLVCLAIQSDGTHPDVRKVLALDQLVAIENVANKQSVQLVFRNGIVTEIDFDLKEGGAGGVGGNAGEGTSSSSSMLRSYGGAGAGAGGNSSSSLRKERFLWSLLQVHAILCTSVIERNMSRADGGTSRSGTGGYITSSNLKASTSSSSALPTLTMRNVDRAELQYISTVNGFLSDSPVMCALLERQRRATTTVVEKGKISGSVSGATGNVGREAMSSSEEKGVDEMDGIAYDMIMGNFSQLTLFLTEEEKQDAEEILNSTIWQDGKGHDGDGGKVNMDEISTAETLTAMLQKRMRDLEAETCRRLIAWEDEKYYNSTGNIPMRNRRDTMEALSLSVLFKTLDDLDEALEDMEDWLSDKAAAIKPLTDDCRVVEEENKQLGFQRKSYTLISSELKRLVQGLEIPDHVEMILRDPTSKMVYHANGDIDIVKSRSGVEDIYTAGRVLKESFDKAQDEGGVHLRGVRDRLEGLLNLSNSFCDTVADTVIAVMERTAAEIGGSDDFDYLSSSHDNIGKKIRSIQRTFQSSLLTYVQLNEVLALLKPSKLPIIRQAYSQLVSDGILTKKRMKSYFASLPGKSSTNNTSFTNELKEYATVALRSSTPIEPGTANMEAVEAKDIDMALSGLLPVVAREAYFTAALFGLSAKHLSGREKKRNFEAAKKSVDFSTQYFKYYMSRICGIASEANAEGKKVEADPMLSFVASTLLNEAMDGYIDRQKKGGDHSLSLAYVRATILDLRKKVDKQWVAWVEDQIKWIQSNPGVPMNGKRAGIFVSFSRFPSYLDHVMICIKSGRPVDQVPNLSKIKVVAYYLQKMAGALFNSLHECSERETTDQQYAANVMRMENSYFFTQTIKQRGPELMELFQKQITAASSICKQSTDAYLGFMIKREFKPLHTLFANISRIRREVGDADVPIHVPRSTFEKTLTKECSKEILKEKIGAIYYRLEKHLSETGGLLPVAWKALVKVLYEWVGRWEKLSKQCYNFTLEPSASDVVRIAKQAAGISAKRISDEKKRGLTS